MKIVPPSGGSLRIGGASALADSIILYPGNYTRIVANDRAELGKSYDVASVSKTVAATFIPTVVAAGQATNSFNETDSQNYHQWGFNVSLNDGNWNTTTNRYTIPLEGFYQFSLQGFVQPADDKNNAYTWMMKYDASSLLYSFSTFNNLEAKGNSYNQGGVITMYMKKGTPIEFGGKPCTGCRSGATYNVGARSFSIIYLGK